MMKKVLLLLAEGFEMHEASAFTDVFGFADVFGDEEISLTTAGPELSLDCTFGFRDVEIDQTLPEVEETEYDALAIPGGFEDAGFLESAYNEEFLEVIRSFDRSDKPIAGICVGALPIGISGTLEDRIGTTYAHLDGFRQDQLAGFGVTVEEDGDMVIDDNIITSTAPATALDVALALLGKLTDEENRKLIAKMMGKRKSSR